MSAKFGVNYTISAEAARPISVQSTTPLAIVGTAAGLDAGLHFYGSVTKAQEALADKPGTLKGAIAAVANQAVETPVILSVFTDKDSKSEAITAIKQLKKAEAVTAYRPNIIIAPQFSGDVDIAAEMPEVADALKATVIIDLGTEDESEALLKAQVYGSKRIMVCDPAVTAWDIDQEAAVSVPLSPYIAGLICRTDAEREYGFSDSPSNRVINGISGTARPIDFVLGEDCEADRLRDNRIATVIRYDGFRLWGGETTEKQDTIWADLARVRTFDRIAEACQKGVFFAIDRKANQLYYAKRSVEELCRNLTGSQVLIGYEVSWNKDKNTAATVTQGKFYLDIKMQNNPIVKTLELDFAYVDTYSDKLLADINN